MLKKLDLINIEIKNDKNKHLFFYHSQDSSSIYLYDSYWINDDLTVFNLDDIANIEQVSSGDEYNERVQFNIKEADNSLLDLDIMKNLLVELFDYNISYKKDNVCMNNIEKGHIFSLNGYDNDVLYICLNVTKKRVDCYSLNSDLIIPFFYNGKKSFNLISDSFSRDNFIRLMKNKLDRDYLKYNEIYNCLIEKRQKD